MKHKHTEMQASHYPYFLNFISAFLINTSYLLISLPFISISIPKIYFLASLFKECVADVEIPIFRRSYLMWSR